MALSVQTDRGWLALSVSVTVITDRRRSWVALLVPCRALGTGPRPSTHGTIILGLTGYTDAEYIFHMKRPIAAALVN